MHSKNAALHDSTFLQPLLLRERRDIFIFRYVTLGDNRAKIAVHVFKLPGLTVLKIAFVPKPAWYS